MRILLANDDGIAAVGIRALVRALSVQHEVTVAAPASEQSGMSHAITVGKDMEISTEKELEETYGVTAWKINGTPTDCVKMYLEAIAKEKPDLVISGINRGSNLGTDVLYSGTVGAAMEGYLHGISALAVSLDVDSVCTYEQVAEEIRSHIEGLFQRENKIFFHNINFPKKLQDDGVNYVFTQLGNRDYLNAFCKRVDETGRVFYRMEGEIYDQGNSEATDIFAVDAGYVSVTPLQTDLTNYLSLDKRLRG